MLPFRNLVDLHIDIPEDERKLELSKERFPKLERFSATIKNQELDITIDSRIYLTKLVVQKSPPRHKGPYVLPSHGSIKFNSERLLQATLSSLGGSYMTSFLSCVYGSSTLKTLSMNYCWLTTEILEGLHQVPSLRELVLFDPFIPSMSSETHIRMKELEVLRIHFGKLLRRRYVIIDHSKQLRTIVLQGCISVEFRDQEERLLFPDLEEMDLQLTRANLIAMSGRVFPNSMPMLQKLSLAPLSRIYYDHQTPMDSWNFSYFSKLKFLRVKDFNLQIDQHHSLDTIFATNGCSSLCNLANLRNLQLNNQQLNIKQVPKLEKLLLPSAISSHNFQLEQMLDLSCIQALELFIVPDDDKSYQMRWSVFLANITRMISISSLFLHISSDITPEKLSSLFPLLATLPQLHTLAISILSSGEDNNDVEYDLKIENLPTVKVLHITDGAVGSIYIRNLPQLTQFILFDMHISNYLSLTSLPKLQKIGMKKIYSPQESLSLVLENLPSLNTFSMSMDDFDVDSVVVFSENVGIPLNNLRKEIHKFDKNDGKIIFWEQLVNNLILSREEH